MAREIVAPKIIGDKERLAEIGIAEVSRMRMDQLPGVNARHAEEDKKLLKAAVTHINRLGIFPTVELIVPVGENDSETVPEQLLFVSSTTLQDDYINDYYLNPQGVLLSYFRIGGQTVRRSPASDRDYMYETFDALLAVEHRIQDAMKTDKPKLRLIKGGGIGEKLFSGTATSENVRDWITDNTDA
jgi:hypothetical protein